MKSEEQSVNNIGSQTHDNVFSEGFSRREAPQKKVQGRRPSKEALLEAALFMSNDPMSLTDLSKMLKSEEEKIKEMLDALKESLKNNDRGIHIIETETGYQMRVKPEYLKIVRTLTPYQDLSRGLLRVLALVAYKQPMTQSDIVKVIGNRTYEYVKILIQKGLLKAEKHGRTRALYVTKGFADYFGLENPEDAKKLLDGLKLNIEKSSENNAESDEENNGEKEEKNKEESNEDSKENENAENIEKDRKENENAVSKINHNLESDGASGQERMEGKADKT